MCTVDRDLAGVAGRSAISRNIRSGWCCLPMRKMGVAGGASMPRRPRKAGEQRFVGPGKLMPAGSPCGLSPLSFVGSRSWRSCGPGWSCLRPYGVYGFDKGGGGSDTNPLQGAVGAVVGEHRPDSATVFRLSSCADGCVGECEQAGARVGGGEHGGVDLSGG